MDRRGRKSLLNWELAGGVIRRPRSTSQDRRRSIMTTFGIARNGGLDQGDGASNPPSQGEGALHRNDPFGTDSSQACRQILSDAVNPINFDRDTRALQEYTRTPDTAPNVASVEGNTNSPNTMRDEVNHSNAGSTLEYTRANAEAHWTLNSSQDGRPDTSNREKDHPKASPETIRKRLASYVEDTSKFSDQNTIDFHICTKSFNRSGISSKMKLVRDQLHSADSHNQASEAYKACSELESELVKIAVTHRTTKNNDAFASGIRSTIDKAKQDYPGVNINLDERSEFPPFKDQKEITVSRNDSDRASTATSQVSGETQSGSSTAAPTTRREAQPSAQSRAPAVPPQRAPPFSIHDILAQHESNHAMDTHELQRPLRTSYVIQNPQVTRASGRSSDVITSLSFQGSQFSHSMAGGYEHELGNKLGIWDSSAADRISE